MQLDGRHNAEGPALDGEEYFAMALFMASARWGEGLLVLFQPADAGGYVSNLLTDGNTAGRGHVPRPSLCFGAFILFLI